MKTVLERFEEKYEPVTESGCWIWTAALWSGGRYGCFGYEGKMQSAHKLSLLLYKGISTDDKSHVLHKCDNGLCVNPDHLFVGTHAENMQDMLDKGRYVAHKQVLFEADVAKAKEMRALGMQVKDVASFFGISTSHMSRLLRDVYNRHDSRKLK